MENNRKTSLANFDKTGQPVSNIPNMKGQTTTINRQQASGRMIPTVSSISLSQGEDMIKDTAFRKSDYEKSPQPSANPTTEDFANVFGGSVAQGSDNKYSDSEL